MDLLALFGAITTYVGTYHFIGYLAVFLGSFLETIPFTGLFVPSNIIMVLAGIFAYEGYLRISSVLALAVLGGTLGDMFSFWLGRKHNHNYQTKPLAKKRAYFEKAEAFFNAHGGKSIFAARFVGPLRPFIAFVAGTCGMPFFKFICFSIASAVAWAVAFFSLGYAFEGSLETALAWLERIDRVAVGVVIAFALFLVLRRFWKRGKIGKKIAADSTQ